MHRTVRVLSPPSHVFPHSDQSPISHLEEKSPVCRRFNHRILVLVHSGIISRFLNNTNVSVVTDDQ